MRRKAKIPLSPTYGINPCMALCPRCGEQNGEILLLGASRKRKCLDRNCGAYSISYAGDPDKKCPKCGGAVDTIRDQVVDGSRERVFGNSLCEACEDKDTACKAEVGRGGVFFCCKKCHSEGAIKAEHPLSKAVREHSGISEGPVGVELEVCIVCEREGGDDA